MGERPGESSALEEFEAYYSTLPAAFKEKLHFGKKGIPGDFVNNYAPVCVQMETIRTEAEDGLGVQSNDINALNEYIHIMISYREYLSRLIGNVVNKYPDIAVNVPELVAKLMDIPLVAEMEANILEIKRFNFEAGSPDLFEKMARLQELVDIGIAIIKDTATIEQLKQKFPDVVR